MKVRIKFRKSGPMVFIGHLDVMRYFQKAIRRADIDIAYTQGFNPHQIMSFAAPLGVGLCSDGEYFDIECNSVTTSDDMRDRLQAAMVEGFEIVNVRSLPDTAGNAMASVAAAKYVVRLRYDAADGIDYPGLIGRFYDQPTIPVVKQTKKSEKEIDIRPHIYELSCEMEKTADGKEKPVFTMLVNASSAGNIKPSFVLESFYRFAGLQAGEFDWIVTRIDTYTNTGTDESPVFVPLDEVGRIIGETGV
jgi:radical SAM-linked protein